LSLFSGCSTKEVYKPIKVDSDWQKYESSKHTIIDTSSNVALLEDRTVLGKKGTFDITIAPSDRVISQSEDWIISASIDGVLRMVSTKDQNKTELFDLKKSIASASVFENTLAVLFVDNDMALYDVETKQLLFKEQGGKSIAVDSRIANPYFIPGIVLFPTLDGKIVFVNTKRNKRLRTVIVSSEENFNNIISLHQFNNKIVAATSYKILSMAKQETRAKYEIRNIIYDENSIYVGTKQGEVLSLDSNLNVNSKIKFPFAHFYGMLDDDKNLYVLEKEGYMIVIDKKSFDYKVYEMDFDDSFIFTSGKTFYVNEQKILID
jgi:uncharacterized membrane protein